MFLRRSPLRKSVCRSSFLAQSPRLRFGSCLYFSIAVKNSSPRPAGLD